MNKYLKYALWTVTGIAVLLVSAVAYIALTFDPNTYKPQIIQAVKDSKQRTLKLDGDIKLFFFPSIGVNIGQVSLSEFQSEQEFAAVDSLKVSLALLPLLSKQVVVDEVAVSGIKAHVIKFKNGKTNLDDLVGKNATSTPEEPPKDAAPAEPASPASTPIKFDIASVLIDKAEFGYSDEASGAKYEIKELSLKTGRIANGALSKVDFAAHVLANQPKLDAAIKLKTSLLFDLEKNIFQMKDLALQAGGLTGKDTFDIKLDVPELGLQQTQFKGKGIALNAKLDAAFGKVTALLALPLLEGDTEKFKLNELALKVDVAQTEQAFKLKLTTPISGNLKTMQFNLSDLLLALNASGDKLPGKSVSSELKGSVQADIGRQSIQANLAGGLLDSQLKAKAAVNNFAAPVIRYDLEIDHFDADPFIPKPAADAEAKAAQSAKEKLPEQAIDLSALKALNVEGSVRIGSLKAANVKVNQLRVDVKGKNGIVKVAPFAANLYAGSINSDITLNVSKGQQFEVNAKLNGIEIGPLLKDALKLDFVSGKGNVGFNLSTQGSLIGQMKKNLNGNLSVSLVDGAVKGINLAKSAREFGKGDKTQGTSKDEQTDFSEMKASFKISKGVAHNEDLSLKSPFVRVGGKGDIDLGTDSIDYLVKATIARTAEGQGGRDDVGGLTLPVRVSGPFTDLKFKLEFGSVVSDAAKQKAQQAIDAGKEQAKAKAREQLKQGLKGLFK